jgi:cell division protein FtsW
MGGVFGVFPGNSTERDFLPQAYSDFIYAIIIEEMGLLGGMFVLLLYLVILIRGGIIARKTEKLFPKYLVMGSALMLSIQAFINMAVAVNLIPVTGQPLPLISRGGTSTLITCAYFGLILSADRFGISKKKEGDSVDSDDKSNEVGGIDGDDNKDSSNPEDVSVNGLEDKVEFEIYQV